MQNWGWDKPQEPPKPLSFEEDEALQGKLRVWMAKRDGTDPASMHCKRIHDALLLAVNYGCKVHVVSTHQRGFFYILKLEKAHAYVASALHKDHQFWLDFLAVSSAKIDEDELAVNLMLDSMLDMRRQEGAADAGHSSEKPA